MVVSPSAGFVRHSIKILDYLVLGFDVRSRKFGFPYRLEVILAMA